MSALVPIDDELVTVMGGARRDSTQPIGGNPPGNRLRWQAEPSQPPARPR
ncbi:MAG TPA: hypothetical protein VGM88_27320 [Kofleriaceae bacterium]